ncbi:MAG: SpoIIE family protein phosphatase [Lysobacterales bacterium]
MRDLVLEILSGPALPSRQLTLDEPRVLGRHPDSDWVLADAGVSRRHAGIELRGSVLYLRDLGSRAGTFVNDQQVDPNCPVPLSEHDRLRIGPWRFRVRRQESAPARGMTGVMSAVSLGSATRIAAPVLAAERRLELLVEFAATTVAADDVRTIVTQLADFAQRGSAARVASVWLQEEGSMHLAASVPTAESAFPCISELCEGANQGGVVQADIELPGTSGTRPVLAVALRVDKETRGSLLIELSRPDPRARSDAAEFVHALARLAGLTLGNVERRDMERRVQRLHADLDQAREVQRLISPPAHGVCAGTRYAFHVHPGRMVAGDLVDVFALDEYRCAVVLGDVAGNGVGAGFLMASVQAYLHAELLVTRDPGLAATRCNRYISRIGGGHFATAWIGVVDARDRRIRYVDAGHGHGRHMRSGGEPHKLEGRGAIPLGIDAGAQFDLEELSLEVADRLILYSDGVAEIKGSSGDTFAPAVLDQILRRGGLPKDDVAAVIAGMEIFAGGSMPSDDASILAFDLPG